MAGTIETPPSKTPSGLEVWADIEGYVGIYQVSCSGNVRAIKRNKNLSQGDSRGYNNVFLYYNGLRKKKSIHRLVAQAFLPNPDDLPVVNHIDSDKKNNHVSNLEWCTFKHNVQHSVKEGTHAIGSRNYNSKLTEEDVRVIRERRIAGNKYVDLAKIYEVSWKCISQLCRRVTWKHVD